MTIPIEFVAITLSRAEKNVVVSFAVVVVLKVST
jgi:hypothetical protein